jgi:hypothetical protein
MPSTQIWRNSLGRDLALVELASCAGPSRDAVAAHSQPAENHVDQPQHHGRGATDYSVATAGTTVGDGQNQPSVHDGD